MRGARMLNSVSRSLSDVGLTPSHVGVLSRAYLAVDTAAAAEVSLDDAALRSVETVGESLEQVSKAMVEET